MFFAMIMTTVLSLAITLIDGARYSAARLEIATVHQTAGYSVLSQYHRLLLERYGLLFFHTADLEERSMEYMNSNFEIDAIGRILKVRDLLALEVEENQLESVTLATDSKGMVLRRQCVACMEEKYGITYLKQLAKQIGLAEESDCFKENPSYQIQGEEWSEDKIRGETEAYLQDTLIPSSFHYLEKEALKFLVGQTAISEKELSKESLASKRELLQGEGLSETLEFENNQWEQLLFIEYVLEYTGNQVEPLEDGYLKYQTEYILSGNVLDGANLWNVANRLLEIRTCANAIGILADEGRNSLLGELSNSLAAALGNPEVEPVIYAALLILWAEIEGIYDVRNLLQGEGVSLLKADEDWLIDISTIAGIAKLSKTEESKMDSRVLLGEETIQDQGSETTQRDTQEMHYSDYLRVLLWLQDGEITALRLMDIIESDIWEITGQDTFRLDLYADRFRLKTKVQSAYEKEFWITREYGY